MGLLLDAPVAETELAGVPGYDFDQVFCVTGYITGTALGTARLTLRWTDPIDGAQVRNFDMLVSAIGIPIQELVPVFQASDSNLTYQVSHLGVIGTPAYVFNIAQHV